MMNTPDMHVCMSGSTGGGTSVRANGAARSRAVRWSDAAQAFDCAQAQAFDFAQAQAFDVAQAQRKPCFDRGRDRTRSPVAA